MIAKIAEQAGGERPGLGLRWYDTDRLDRVGFDWVAISGADFSELLIAAREHPALVAQLRESMDVLLEARAALTDPVRQEALRDLATWEVWVRGQSDDELREFFQNMDPELKVRLINVLSPANWPPMHFVHEPAWQPTEEEIAQLKRDFDAAVQQGPMAHVLVTDQAEEDRGELERQLAAARAEIENLQAMLNHPRALRAHERPVHEGIAELNTTVVYAMHTNAYPPMVHQGVHITPAGQRETFKVESVRVERASGNVPMLFVNDCQVRRGELYIDGAIQCRVGLGTDIG